MTEQEALQEFWDNALHPSLKPEISEEAKAVAMKALEKQIPKKPKSKRCDEKTAYTCECGKKHLVIYREGLIFGNKNKYCEQCGQAIDWEGYRDEKTSN